MEINNTTSNSREASCLLKQPKEVWRIKFRDQRRILIQTYKTIICLIVILSFFPFETTIGSNSTPPGQVSLYLKWRHGYQFAGYYAALEKGYYRDAGLDVVLKEASVNLNSTDAVLNGISQYGVGSSSILNARLSGDPLVVLAAIFQHSSYVLLSRKDRGIRSPSDLIGKKVMLESDSEYIFFEAVLRQEGLVASDVRIVPNTWMLDDIINGNVDAVAAYITDQPNQMKLQGVEPFVLRPIDYGIDFYGDCLFTSEKEIAENPDRVKAFRQASLKGWEYAMNNVDEMIDLILLMPDVRNRGVTAEHLKYEAEQMKHLILPNFIEIGHINPGRWKHIADTYVGLGLLDKNYSLDGFIYDPNQHPNNKWIRILLLILISMNLLVLFAWIGRRQILKIINSRTQVLRESEAKLIQAQELAGIVKWDLNLVDDLFYNMADFFEFYNVENKDGKISFDGFLGLIHPDDREKVKVALSHAIENNIVYEVEHRLLLENGRIEWVSEFGKIEYDEHGVPIRAFGTTQNITHFKNVETELKEALEKATESDRIKSTFLATISHELRTPLNPIIGFSELINEEMAIGDIINFNKIINASGNHLLGIVEDLFDITLIESGEVKIVKEDINIHFTLSNVLDIIKLEQRKLEKDEIQIEINVPENFETSYVSTDLSKFKQILLNLLKNALKFTQKGQISFGYKEVEMEGENMLEFFVKDTGIGVAKEKHETIFNLFIQAQDSNTREYGGTGIGLSICKKLSELLGGKIWLESEFGKGSTFFFTIPMSRSLKEMKMVVEEEKKRIDLKEELVLVVEDDKLSSEYLSIVLLKVGIKTVSANNGKRAVEICKENQNVKLVLMDVNMPEMNGYEATKAIKQIKPELPVIMQTAYAILGDEGKCMQAGANGYLSKPIKKEKLIEMVSKYLGK